MRVGTAKTLHDAFWRYAQWEDGHLLWKGPTDSNHSRPRLNLGSKTYNAKKVSLQLVGKTVPPDARYSATCGILSCLHPEHLSDYLVTRGLRAGTKCKCCGTQTRTTINPEGDDVPWKMPFCYLCQSEVDRMGQTMFLSKMKREGLCV